MGGGDSK